MTNNDELALKLKAAADKATADEWIHDGDGEIKILSNKLDVARVWSDLCNRNNDAEFIATANPASILALLAERDADKKRIAEMNDTLERECEKSRRMASRIAELETVSAAAEKLVRCKGRYHSEQNYRALAALFGVKTPDLPPLETEARTVSVKLPAVYDLVGDCDGNGNLNEAEMVASRDGIYARVSDIKAAGIKLEVGE